MANKLNQCTRRRASDFAIGMFVKIEFQDDPELDPEVGLCGEVVIIEDDCIGVSIPGFIGHSFDGYSVSMPEPNGWWLNAWDIAPLPNQKEGS